jgi:hypothetical protein
MNREIARYRAVTAKRYARSDRQAVQVDFLAYLREIRKERQAGAKRSRASRALAADPPIWLRAGREERVDDSGRAVGIGMLAGRPQSWRLRPARSHWRA